MAGWLDKLFNNNEVAGNAPRGLAILNGWRHYQKSKALRDATSQDQDVSSRDELTSLLNDDIEQQQTSERVRVPVVESRPASPVFESSPAQQEPQVRQEPEYQPVTSDPVDLGGAPEVKVLAPEEPIVNQDGIENEASIEMECEATPDVGEVDILEFSQIESVTKVQTLLLGAGYNDVGDDHGSADGMFGKKTGQALEDFLKKTQETAGLEQTGEYDEATRQALVDNMDTFSEDSPQHDSLRSFVQGMDELRDNMVPDENGINERALDRIYNPSSERDQDCAVAAVDPSRSVPVDAPHI